MSVSSPASNIIKIAVLAVGGQGGGVLSNWLVDLAESNGYRAQSTSVPGVAQRTGATIYYVEMAPATEQMPIFALMPTPGDVDIVLAAEIMEAGRAISRGIITPERTKVITSSHRIYAVSEKAVPGDGRLDVEPVINALQQASNTLITFDMQATALANNSHISAAMLGALAGSNSLPFERQAFEQTITQSGRGVEASLRCFAAAYEQAQSNAQTDQTEQPKAACELHIPASKQGQWQQLQEQVTSFPTTLQPTLTMACERLAAYQDISYANEYLALVAQAQTADEQSAADPALSFTHAVAEQLVNAMCYADVINVADIKTQQRRQQGMRQERGIGVDDVIQVTEFLHPRVEEICGLLPTGIGRWAEHNTSIRGFIERRFDKGMRLRSQSLRGFFALYCLAGLKPWRRKLWRHQEAQQHWQAWLALALENLPQNYQLATAIINSQRLIKGYGDTYSRSLANYAKLIDCLPILQSRVDGAECFSNLNAALLADSKGQQYQQLWQRLINDEQDAIPSLSV